MVSEKVFIGLGTNMGDKPQNIERALERLDGLAEIEVVAVAPFYRTAPVGYTEQDWFLNTVAEVKTSLSPHILLSEMLGIEDVMGRKRLIRWGPRVVDLDLLLYGQRVISEPDLVVPHPRMLERAFVMVPLADLDPDIVLSNGKMASECARELREHQEIVRCVS